MFTLADTREVGKELRVAVVDALKETMEMKRNVNGPKKLKVFGASYLYPIFLRFDLIKTERE